jgi:shikimate dehydrogenase
MRWSVGVAGSPIAHSVTPALHEEGLRIANLQGTSERVELEREDASQLSTLLGDRFDALSITMPLKFVAGEYCDALDEVASRTGSVNSMLVRDGQGFLDALAGELSFDVAGAQVVVLGAGGAARAIIDALVAADVSSVTVFGRTPGNVDFLTSLYDNVHDVAVPSCPVDLIVNTVPDEGRPDEAVLVEGVAPDTVAVDITYVPAPSTWLALHEQVGCRTQNGLAMLAYQAALQMQWWWDVEMDGASLLRAIS